MKRSAVPIQTGQPQVRHVFGLEWWDYLNANPKEVENFGEALKANSLNSLKGVLEQCDFRGVKKVVDVGGGLAIWPSRCSKSTRACKP